MSLEITLPRRFRDHVLESKPLDEAPNTQTQRLATFLAYHGIETPADHAVDFTDGSGEQVTLFTWYRCSSCHCVIEGDYSMCDDCENQPEDDYDSDDDIDCLHDHSHKPDVVTYTKKWETRPLLLGLEIELSNEYSYRVPQLVEKIEADYGCKAICKSDGSIDDYGVEVVFQPHTLQAMKQLRLRDFLGHAHDCDWRAYKRGCGLHIHVNRDFFSDESRAYTWIRDWIVFNSYSVERFSKRSSFGFCQIRNDCDPKEKYQAIRWHDEVETFEFRVFRGTTDYTRVLASIQFVDAICHYALVSSRSRLTTWQAFLIWCRQEKRYGHFVNYCFRHGITGSTASITTVPNDIEANF